MLLGTDRYFSGGGGGDEKSLSANIFFIYATLQTIFF